VATSSSDHYQLSDSERLKTTQAYVEKKFGSEPEKYEVQPGDNLWDISREFDVSVRSLAKWNGMATTDMLHPGRELLIFGSSKSVQNLASLSGYNQVIRKVNYKVRRGESLSRIANKFNLSVNSIKKWNHQISKQKYIQPGDKITLYVDVTQTE
ncbi:MAG: LysM peptidoglycan-binding domain-containing protein, partial [bacterium]